MDSRQAQGTIPPQVLTDNPLSAYPSCLVDDPVYLVDDSRVLVGSQFTAIADTKLSVDDGTPESTGDTFVPNQTSDDNTPTITIQRRD